MIPEPIPNLYQDRFLRLTENGELTTDAIIKRTHRYLDGKPTKVGKRSLSAADRDLEFWMASFWDDVSKAIAKLTRLQTPSRLGVSDFAATVAAFLWNTQILRPNAVFT